MKYLVFKILLSFIIISCSNSQLESSKTKTISSSEIIINQKINGSEVSRSVLIQAPLEIDTSKDYPVVFAFHGNGGSNRNWINILKKFTDNGEFIGIYPQGYLKSWNLGSEKSTADDVEFTNLIVDEIKNYLNLNFNKMYAIGSSNGSGMVNKLAIETNHFNAIAPIVSQLMQSMPIKPSTQPISIFQVNGGKDNVVPINGGPGPGTHVFLDALDSAKLWASTFDCSSSELKFVGDSFEEYGVNRLYDFKNCDAGKEVRYLRLENIGHGVTRSYSILFDEVWKFFKKF